MHGRQRQQQQRALYVKYDITCHCHLIIAAINFRLSLRNMCTRAANICALSRSVGAPPCRTARKAFHLNQLNVACLKADCVACECVCALCGYSQHFFDYDYRIIYSNVRRLCLTGFWMVCVCCAHSLLTILRDLNLFTADRGREYLCCCSELL